MATITHRVGLGRNLTAAEVDANFDALNSELASVGSAVVRFAAEWGIVDDPTLAVDQRSRFAAMVADLTAEGYAGEVVLPAGDICLTPGLSWAGAGKTKHQFYATTDDRIIPPTLRGAGIGATRIRWLGAPSNGVLMAWSVTDAQAGDGVIRVEAPNVENIDFIGPGQSVTKTTLASNASIGGSVTLSSSVSAGDAVCLIDGSRRHWFTAQSTGAVQTPDARQALLRAWSSASTVVVVFKQSIALQFGGTRSAGSTIVQEVGLQNVRFSGFFAGAFCDDVTVFTAEKPTFQNVVHGISFGYNCDTFTLNVPFIGTDRPPVSATCTNGSATVTITPGAVVEGEKLYEAPGADGALNLPEHTYVVDVSGSTATLSHPYAGTTGAKTLYAVQGALFAAGQGGAACLGAYSGNTLNNLTALSINNPIAGRIEQLGWNADTVAAGVFVNGGYLEAVQRVITHGAEGGSGAGGPYLINGLVVQGANLCAGPAIHDQLGGSSQFDIKIIGIDAPKFPLFVSRSENPVITLREGWSWANDSTAATGYGQSGPAIVAISESDNNAATAVDQRTRFEWRTTSLGRAGPGGAIMVRNHSGALNWNWPLVAGMDLTLTGALTAGSIIWGMPPKGYRVSIALTQGGSGSYAVTLGSDFIKGDGSSMGTISGGAVGTGLTMEFVSTGNKLVLQCYQSPVFA